MLERLPIREDWVLGVDLGIGSCGIALVQLGQDPRILFMGSRCFEVPENPKDKSLKNAKRRAARLMRRTLRRRRQRMAAIRRLFATHAHAILPAGKPDDFHHRKDAPDPWRARAEGLSRALTKEEFAAALLHIAKHRGFKSTKKSESGANAPDDDKKMPQSVKANEELSAKYQTVGEMLFLDPKFAAKKRNTSGDYCHTLPRDALAHEVGVLFERQRKFGNAWANSALQDAYVAIAFFQRPVQDSEEMVGTCPLEHQHGRSAMRTARHAPSFERFRLLSRLNAISIRQPGGVRHRISPAEIALIDADFGAQKSITFATLRKMLSLPKQAFFEGIEADKEKRDVCAGAGAAAGTYAIRSCLGETLWRVAKANPEALDRAAEILAFREDIANIERGLRQTGLDPAVADKLLQGARDGAFSHFQKAGHVSAKAAREMIPHLLQGQVYSEAAKLAGYDHAAERTVTLDDIRNAVVARAIREGRAQIRAVIREFGHRPGSVQIELARDVGKGPKERKEIEEGNKKRTAKRECRREEMRTTILGGRVPTDYELLKYELWKEQDHKCIYTMKCIAPEDLADSRNTVQVDHILPRSQSQDNSYTNLALCFVSANQNKRRRTPYEWFGKSDPARWEQFEAWVRTLKIKGFKKRNLLLQNFDAERQERFVNRNLNDTRYGCRALAGEIRLRLYPETDGNRRVFARPGAITAMLRKSWGLEVLKKGVDGERIADDRHHAIDALVCAGCNEATLQKLTKVYQREEELGREDFVPSVPPPWPSFRNDALAAYEKVFVSRSERARARGQGHDDTVRQVKVVDGETLVYERKEIAKLEKDDLKLIKNPERNKAIVDALAAWIDAGKPADKPPRSPKGDVIRKVRIETNKKSGVKVRDGLADSTSMVRVDVFVKNGKYFLVPIYSYQVLNKAEFPKPPNKAISAHKPESEWNEVDQASEFLLSLYPDCYVEVVKADGQVIEGYYRGTDRSSGSIGLSLHNIRDRLIRGIGVRTLRSIKKFTVDRLGRKHPVGREKRTWHGEVCT